MRRKLYRVLLVGSRRNARMALDVPSDPGCGTRVNPEEEQQLRAEYASSLADSYCSLWPTTPCDPTVKQGHVRWKEGS
jgi:hypothetical protein